MGRKRIIIIIVAVIVIGLGALVFYATHGGFTKKQSFTNCMETCYGLLFFESSKEYCPEKCMEETGYKTGSQEINKLVNTLKATNTNTIKSATNSVANVNINTSSSVNKNSNTAAATSNAVNKTTISERLASYQARQYYCDWTWPQIIIDKDTKEEIVQCPSSLPYCHYADYSFDAVECCTNDKYTSCQTLIDVLKIPNPNKQYDCAYGWPQDIIERGTTSRFKECTMDRPYCYYADYSYDKVGCCEDAEHKHCTTLPNLE